MATRSYNIVTANGLHKREGAYKPHCKEYQLSDAPIKRSLICKNGEYYWRYWNDNKDCYVYHHTKPPKEWLWKKYNLNRQLANRIATQVY